VVCLLALAACQQRETAEVIGPDTAAKPDIVHKGDATTGHAYLAGNAFHERRIDVLLRRADVSAAVEQFAIRGFRPAPEFSFTIWGKKGQEAVLATFIALTGDARSAVVLCYGSGADLKVSPVEFASDKPVAEPGWKPFIGSGWYNTPAGGGVNRSSQQSNATDWWDWSFFGTCMVELAPAAAAGCGVQCVLVPGYWHCFLYCVTAEALAATLTCILQMYGRGADGGGPHEQVREEE
jgi:hypothetical protein